MSYDYGTHDGCGCSQDIRRIKKVWSPDMTDERELEQCEAKWPGLHTPVQDRVINRCRFRAGHLGLHAASGYRWGTDHLLDEEYVLVYETRSRLGPAIRREKFVDMSVPSKTWNSPEDQA